MEQMGIYLTDASFDKNTGVSSISFVDKISKKTQNLQINTSKNILESEFIGIKECLKNGYRKYKNVVVFCDSIGAINKAKKELFKSMKLNERFNYVQFVWLPRDFLSEADFLTKNIEDTELNKEKKIEGYKNKIKGNVLDIFISNEDKEDILKEYLFDFFKEVDTSKFNFKSDTFKNILIEKTIVSKITEEVDLISLDIKMIIKEYPKQGYKNSLLQKITELLYSF